MKKLGDLTVRINNIIKKADALPLWWVGFLQLAVMIVPNLLLGEGSVFTIHDQLDESMMNYVLTARHPFASEIPEMLGGINASGLEPSAVLFVPFFWIFPPFAAFMLCYVFMAAAGFFGMYFLLKELTGSSLLAVLSAGVFCMLPSYPVYGLSQMGIPLVCYAFLCLARRKKRGVSLGLILLFGLTSHLVYTGYAVLALVLAALLFWGIWGEGRERFPRVGAGFGLLLLCYVVTNIPLIFEILFGKSLSGEPAYVSHREEMVNAATPFVQTVKSMFLSGGQHAFTFHTKLILPILLMLVAGALLYRRLGADAQKIYRAAVGGILLLGGIAVFFGVCKSAPVADFKNHTTGFLHYFQAERFYWLYPAGWYMELALCAGVFWNAGDLGWKWWRKASFLTCLLAFAAILWPAADEVLHHSYFYTNVNQYNNGSQITGYISWESYYAEDLMERIDEAIGRDKTTYRVAHLGISPAPALMHGFYTADGYSNNYPLEYKHRFREVIAAELSKNPETAAYFDTWGNRCYLFNSQTGTYWMLQKGTDAVCEGLAFDMGALSSLGCEYLLSGAEIADAESMGLSPVGYFETDSSYWGVWLYEVNASR